MPTTEYVDPSTARHVETASRRLVVLRLTKAALSLRDMADAVDRIRQTVEEMPETTVRSGTYVPYSEAVSRFQHEIIWGTANLNLAELVADAAQADRFRAQALVAEEQEAAMAAVYVEGQRLAEEIAVADAIEKSEG